MLDGRKVPSSSSFGEAFFSVNLSIDTEPVHVTQTARVPNTSVKLLVFPSPVPHTHLYIIRPRYVIRDLLQYINTVYATILPDQIEGT